MDKTYRKRYENLLRERDHQNKLIQLTAEKIQYFKETEPEKFNKINNLRGMYEGKEVKIDVYVTSEYQSYQRDPNNPTMILDFSSGGYTGFPSEGVLTIAVNSGKKVNVSTHLDPSLPKNTDRIAHEFGHIYGFSLDMLKYIRENTAGDNCQEIAKQGGVLLLQLNMQLNGRIHISKIIEKDEKIFILIVYLVVIYFYRRNRTEICRFLWRKTETNNTT